MTVASTAAGSCFNVTSSGPGAATGLSTRVELQATGRGWEARLTDIGAGDLTVTLTSSAGLLRGTAAGTVTAGAVRVTFSHTLSGAPVPPAAAGGLVDQSVSYEASAGSAVTICSSNGWSLTPR